MLTEDAELLQSMLRLGYVEDPELNGADYVEVRRVSSKRHLVDTINSLVKRTWTFSPDVLFNIVTTISGLLALAAGIRSTY